MRPTLSSLDPSEDGCGVNSGSQLAPIERDLNGWALRTLHRADPPTVDDITGAAREHGVHDVEGALRHRVEFNPIQRDTAGLSCLPCAP